MRARLVFSCSVLVFQCSPSSSTPVAPADGGVVNQCPVQTGPGTTHAGDTIAADTTWSAATSPHHVTSSVTISKGATLTIEPCVRVIIDPGYSITVNGALSAKGNASQPISFDSSDPQKPFGYLRSFGAVDLAYTSIAHGGATDINGLGVIDMRGSSGMPRQSLLRIAHVSIDGSNGFGVSLRDGAAFTADSTDLAIKRAALQPLRASPSLAHHVPTGQYTGNGADEFLIIADANMTDDTTWDDRGVPYRIGDDKGNGNDMRVGPATAAPIVTWTVSPGVTVRVSPGGRILLESPGSGKPATGAIIATGTVDKPIVFTSAAATPAAGDWVGLYIDSPDAKDTISHAQFKFAGGPSLAKSYHCDLMGGLNEAEDAAILVFGQPAAGFVTSTTISDSKGYGIDRAWSGDPIDFIADNTFTNVAKCKQSFPRKADGSCPMMVTCP